MIRERALLSGALSTREKFSTSITLEKQGQVLRVVDKEHNLLLRGFPATTTSIPERRSGHSPTISLEILTKSPTSFTCQARVTNTSPFPVSLESISVLKIPYGFKELSAEEVSAHQTGWQSWSAAGSSVKLEHIKTEKQTETNKKHPDFPDGFIPNHTLLEDTKGSVMLIGFTTANSFHSGIQTASRSFSHSLEAVCLTEGKTVPPSESITSEELFIAFGKSSGAVLRQYQQALKEKHQPPTLEKPLAGWCSWYEHFGDVTEDTIRKNLKAIVRENLPIDVMQIDDGYQTVVGDWAVETKKFPNGLKPLVDTIHESGKKAGIWWSPFLVGQDSQVFAEHPGWLVRDKTTHEPLLARKNWGQDIFILDGTHPEVQEHIRRLTHVFTKVLGFDYLKLDFLYAGALEGEHFDSNATSIESYRSLMQIIKNESEDTTLVGCGAPFLPSAGLVHAMRIGSDTEFVWKGSPNEWKAEPGIAKNVLTPLFERQWMHSVLWANDPDIITLREHDSSLTTAEKQTLITAILLSGGSLFIGDDIEKLNEHNRSLLHRVFPSPGFVATNEGISHDQLPQQQTITTKDGTITALYNWEDTHQIVSFRIPSNMHVFDTWNNSYLGISTDETIVTIPPHGVRLFRTKRVESFPHVIATTNHLLSDAVDLVKETWNGSTLTITQHPQTAGKGTILVHIPEGYDVQTNLSVVQENSMLSINTRDLPPTFSLTFNILN